MQVMRTAANAPDSELASSSHRFGEYLPVEHHSAQPAHEGEGKESNRTNQRSIAAWAARFAFAGRIGYPL
jgi:hypothetical protein